MGKAGAADLSTGAALRQVALHLATLHAMMAPVKAFSCLGGLHLPTCWAPMS